ncbi:MAG: YceI family protein [Acidobacteria bacterium]|nr:YceI family protein [Acidobacteriota bacterium]MBV9474656.1 YceI family protein [Acidobacteriota bacterium]
MKTLRSLALLALLATPLAAQTATTETWVADPAHSETTFKIRHLVSKVSGRFRDFNADINLNRANPVASSVNFTIQAASIDTGNGSRDEHLRSADFFDAAKFPTITFRSTSVAAKSKNSFDVTGDLTMHGVTKRITLPVTFLGFMKDPRGNDRGGFEIDTTLNRKDWGILWNRALDEGGALLGDDVEVQIALEVARKPATPPAAK